jgi:Ca2+-dependent lipid-binding protein
VETVSFTFLDKPMVEFELQPLGVNVMDVPYIANIIQASTRSCPSPRMLYSARAWG